MSEATTKAIQKILDSFDFELVQRVMCLDPERWGGVPKVEELKKEAKRDLEVVADGTYEWVHGRFLATTYKDENDSTALVLHFPIASGETSINCGALVPPGGAS